MEYTKNYKLPQWAEEDRIQMEDFNEAMNTIDTGLTAAQTTASAVQCAAGTYTGNGLTLAKGGLVVELGFRPRFVVISRGWTGSNTVSGSFLPVGDAKVERLSSIICFLENGFQVGLSDDVYQEINTANLEYSYMAIR